MTDIELQRLGAMGSALRPDWPARSLATFIERNLQGRAFGDVAVALAWVATRTKTETPRLLLEAGPWWKAAATETGGHVPRPPRREEACGICGQREEAHRGVNDDHEFRGMGRRYASDDVRSRLPEVRQQLAVVKADLCSHGVHPKLCKDRSHLERPEPEPEPAETEEPA